jgi:DNA-binding HxlR family transcriptional regulator
MSSFPITSLESYRALTPEKLSKDYAKILSALTVLGVAHYEAISDYLGCREPNIVSRRLSELERNQLIYKTGEKRKTKRNRNAFVYCLTNAMPKVENPYQPKEEPIAKEEVSLVQLEMF